MEGLQKEMPGLIEQNATMIKQVGHEWLDLITAYQFLKDSELSFLQKLIEDEPLLGPFFKAVERLINIKGECK